MIALLMRDLRLATRAGGGFGLGLAFFLIVCTLVPFGVGPEGGQLLVEELELRWFGGFLQLLCGVEAQFWVDGQQLMAGQCGINQAA